MATRNDRPAEAADAARGARERATVYMANPPATTRTSSWKCALAQAANLCRPRGIILLLATYWDEVSLPALTVSMKELRIYASAMYGRTGLVRDVEIAAQLLARRPEIAETLITHRLPLDAAPEAFALASMRDAGAIKVVLEP